MSFTPRFAGSLAAATIALGMFAGVAQAVGPTYSFSSGTPSVDVNAQTAILPIYLHEVSGPTSQINSDGGLFSFGFSVSVTGGPGTIQSLTRNPAFDQLDPGSTGIFPTTTASLWAEQNANYPNGPTVDGNGNVLLATLTLQGVSTATTLNIADFGAGSQTVDYAGKALDPSASYSTTVAVPEPATLAVSGAGVMLLLTGRRRRRVA